MSVRNYRYPLHNNPEERSSQLLPRLKPDITHMWYILYAITRQPNHHNSEFPTHSNITADTQTCMVEGQCMVLKLGAKCTSRIRTTKMDHQKGENLKSGTAIHEQLTEHFLMQLK
jgi:hypothetical protein